MKSSHLILEECLQRKPMELLFAQLLLFTQDMFFLMFAITCLTTTETISSDQNFLPQTFLNLLLSANKCTEDFLLLYYLTAELNYVQQLHITLSQ